MFQRILFVEDETHVAELYAYMLRKNGYQVDVINDGGEGLKAAQTGNYDLILLDLMLPTVSGIDALHALRDPAKTPGFTTPVVILTNLGEDATTVADINQYAQGYLLKVDVTPKQLVSYIQGLEKQLKAS